MLVLIAGSFAMLALLLTTLGLYGLLMRAVNLRTREIGIRVALGAQRRAILFTLRKRTLIDIAIGLIVGTATAALFGQVIQNLLNIHSTSGAAGYLVSALLILAVALLAAAPAVGRAVRIDPMQALRSD